MCASRAWKRKAMLAAGSCSSMCSGPIVHSPAIPQAFSRRLGGSP